MKRTIMLLAMSAMALLVFAPSAMALQSGMSALPQTPPHLQPNITNTVGAGQGGYEPKLYGSLEAPATGGTATAPSGAAASDTQPYVDPEGTPAGSSELAPSDTAGAEQYGSEDPYVEQLPDTSGPSLALPAALAVGLVLAVSAIAALRSRSRRGPTV